MASLNNKPNGSRVVGFTDPDGKPRWIYCGVMPRKAAEQIVRHVEALLAAKVAGTPAAPQTAAWLAGLGDELHGKLARAGLAPARERPAARRLEELCSAYLAKRTDVQPRTVQSLRRAVTSLVSHFGPDRDYAKLTRADMAEWKRAGLKQYAQATVANDVKKARQIFADAVDGGLLASNPLAGVKAGSQANPDRLVYVPAATIQKVMETCGEPEWALVFALTRFGGLRCPSETAALTWADVDWRGQRITVTSPKGKRHGKGKRIIPLFPELYLPLLRMHERATDRSGYVLPTLRGENLATHGDRLIRRAGFDPWERTFQNLRASRETDLARLYPIQVVCGWIGNTPAVAVAHYLSVTDEDYRNAAGASECAAPRDAVLPMFGERLPNGGEGTTLQTPKTQGFIAPAGLEHPPGIPEFLLPFVPALQKALSPSPFGLLSPPEATGATHLHAFAEEIYARAEGTVARD